MTIQIKEDGTGYLWDGEDLPLIHFGPCACCTPPHECDYIQKGDGSKTRVHGVGIESACECAEFNALP